MNDSLSLIQIYLNCNQILFCKNHSRKISTLFGVMNHINECFILIKRPERWSTYYTSIIMIMIWQTTNTPLKMLLMNIILFWHLKFTTRLIKLALNYYILLLELLRERKTTELSKYFFWHPRRTVAYFFVSIETVPNFIGLLCTNARVGASVTLTNLMTVTSNTASEHHTTLFIPDLC